jgi:cytochrome P450
MTTRFTYEASALGEKTCQPGDLVVLILGAGNRDPATFPAPRELDVRRDNAHANLAFGGGVHYCLGAPLARLEAEMAVGALLRRLPRIALAKQDLAWRENVVLRGLHRLVVTF